jgi:hypothetical protein
MCQPARGLSSYSELIAALAARHVMLQVIVASAAKPGNSLGKKGYI